MKTRVLTVLFPGFEEIEFVAPVDIMRRAGIEVTIVSLTDQKPVVGRSNIVIQAEKLIDEINPDDYGLLFIPGGPGVKEARKNAQLVKLAERFGKSGKFVAAICAAPTILSDAGLLAGRKFTSHFSVQHELPQTLLNEKVVQDSNIITSRGAGTAVELGLRIVKLLCGKEKSDEIARAIMV
ncbi:MAG: DJ-1 family glyoxalase III [Verrucomicrobiia bacterium]